jgi:hypothetical protein
MTHEDIYRSYSAFIAGREDAWLLNSAIRSERDAAEAVRHRLLGEADLRQARMLRSPWQAARDLDRSGAPFEDAYQAGLWLHLHEDRYFRRNTSVKLYRGQRNEAWATQASLFRPGPMAGARRRERLVSLASHLNRRFGLDDRHAFAASQHYGGEAAAVPGPGAVTTWLLDVTWNPFIALAFASYGAVDGDVAVVMAFDVTEWNDKLTGVADLDVLTLDGLTRPANQEAAFVDSAFPEVSDDYLPLTFRFVQHPGVEFDDAGTNASRNSLYPAGDPLCSAVQEWASQEAREATPAPAVPLSLPARAVRLEPNGPPRWVPPRVFADLCATSLGRLNDPPDTAARPLCDHLELLAVFHAHARQQEQHPGLGALGEAAWAAHQRALRAAPPDLPDMTRDSYYYLGTHGRQLARRLQDLWAGGGQGWARARTAPL